MHHSLIHAIHTRHPSASSVVRLAHRWVASHMMSDLIPQEAIELVVAKIYTESAEKTTALVNTPPSTAVAGFIRFLHLISNHDWVRYVNNSPVLSFSGSQISQLVIGFLQGAINCRPPKSHIST